MNFFNKCCLYSNFFVSSGIYLNLQTYILYHHQYDVWKDFELYRILFLYNSY